MMMIMMMMMMTMIKIIVDKLIITYQYNFKNRQNFDWSLLYQCTILETLHTGFSITLHGQ